jgi:hypothetical protein
MRRFVTELRTTFHFTIDAEDGIEMHFMMRLSIGARDDT